MDKVAMEWADQPLETYEPDIEVPPFRKAIVRRDKLPKLLPELIVGLLRVGAILLLQGASKTGKSFALISLAIALATGSRWLGFQCRKSRVLYINLEIQEASFDWRVADVAEAMGADAQTVEDNLTIWDARGKNYSIEELKEEFAQWEADGRFDAIIIDPLYKVQSGSENDTESINRFFNAIDSIARESGASIIVCHHYPKTEQSSRSVINRSSGSGVFGRAVDAIIDLLEFPHYTGIQDLKGEFLALQSAIPLMASFITRDFKLPESFGLWFDYPLHKRDTTGLLTLDALRKSHSAAHANQMQARVDETITELLEGRESVLRTEVAEALGGKDRKTVDKYVEASSLFEAETIGNNRVEIRRIKME